MNKKELGIALKNELDKGYDIVRISRWAFKAFSSQDPRSFTLNERELLERVFSMQDDPQFEYTEQELRTLSLELISEGEKEEELSTCDHLIREKAEILDDDWLMCPLCHEACKSCHNHKLVKCPNCVHKLHNPRFS